MKNNLLVSIIVTTRNEGRVISNFLKSAQNQSYPNVEIILVDNHSEDNTVEIARKFKIKIYTFGPERSAQRNLGAEKSNGKYILFLDADMRLSKKVVAECVEKIRSNKNIGAVVIPEQSVTSSFWEKVKAYERSFYNLHGDTTIEAARFFKKTVFKKAGGYDEAITGPEDWDLPETVKKLGYKIDRIAAKIYHYERISTLFALARKKFYYGLRAHRYLKKHKISVVSPKTVYFLRPVFYKNWRKLVTQPILTLAMFLVFLIETFAGGLGYLIGRIRSL